MRPPGYDPLVSRLIAGLLLFVPLAAFFAALYLLGRWLGWSR
jgi:hypothetical protein